MSPSGPREVDETRFHCPSLVREARPCLHLPGGVSYLILPAPGRALALERQHRPQRNDGGILATWRLLQRSSQIGLHKAALGPGRHHKATRQQRRARPPAPDRSKRPCWDSISAFQLLDRRAEIRALRRKPPAARRCLQQDRVDQPSWNGLVALGPIGFSDARPCHGQVYLELGNQSRVPSSSCNKPGTSAGASRPSTRAMALSLAVFIVARILSSPEGVYHVPAPAD